MLAFPQAFFRFLIWGPQVRILSGAPFPNKRENFGWYGPLHEPLRGLALALM